MKIMPTITVRGLLKAALLLCVLAAFWNGACRTADLGPRASLLVNPATVVFKDTIGNAAPHTQTLNISTDAQDSAGGLSATVAFGSGSGWLTVSLSGTSAPATMTLTSNISGLTAGAYQATVTIAANGVVNSPVTVPVTFEVAPPPPVKIVVSPATIAFADTFASSAPGAKTVSVTG